MGNKSKSKGQASPAAARSSCGSCGTWAKVIAVALAVLTPLVALVERNLESFYIFDHGELHDLAQRSIAAHGEDTQAMVNFIVAELQEKHPNHVNLDQEWIFNNAGGAMGAMYIIHASTCLSPAVSPTHYPLSCPIRPHHPLWTPHSPY